MKQLPPSGKNEMYGTWCRVRGNGVMCLNPSLGLTILPRKRREREMRGKLRNRAACQQGGAKSKLEFLLHKHPAI